MVVPRIIVIADGVADSSLFFLSERKADDYMLSGTQRQSARDYNARCGRGAGKKNPPLRGAGLEPHCQEAEEETTMRLWCCKNRSKQRTAETLLQIQTMADYRARHCAAQQNIAFACTDSVHSLTFQALPNINMRKINCLIDKFSRFAISSQKLI